MQHRCNEPARFVSAARDTCGEGEEKGEGEVDGVGEGEVGRGKGEGNGIRRGGGEAIEG